MLKIARLHLLPSPKPHTTTKPSNPIHETLHLNLHSLLTSSSSSPNSLPFLSDLLLVLRTAIAHADALFSDAKTPSDPKTLHSFLLSTVPFLDSLNALSSSLSALSLSLLPLRLLSAPDRLRRAKKALSEWKRPRGEILPTFVSDRTAADPPRGEVSAVRSAASAVDDVARLAVAAVASALAGGTGDLGVCAASSSGERPWREAFEGVRERIGEGFSGEIEAVEVGVGRLRKAVEEEETAEIEEAAEEVVRSVAVLMEGLGLLSERVDEVFVAAIKIRRTALFCLRSRLV